MRWTESIHKLQKYIIWMVLFGSVVIVGIVKNVLRHLS
jgi:hypothetical protein